MTELAGARPRSAAADPLDALQEAPPGVRTLSMAVAEQVRRLIVANRIPPGSPLRLATIATRLGVSVQPVREAVRMLAAEGLVVIEPHRGAFVARLSIEDVEELYAVRVALECLIARVATARLSSTDVEALQVRFTAMQAAERRDDQRAFIDADRAFHQHLYELADRPRLLARILDLWDASNRARPLLYETWLPIRDAVADHEPLLRAIETRDPAAAASATRAHLEGAADRVLAALRARG
jgi:DNA-binding GntR family transcriptional regulator